MQALWRAGAGDGLCSGVPDSRVLHGYNGRIRSGFPISAIHNCHGGHLVGTDSVRTGHTDLVGDSAANPGSRQRAFHYDDDGLDVVAVELEPVDEARRLLHAL